MNKKTDWSKLLGLAALPALQLLLGLLLLVNPDGAIALVFRVIGWLLVAVAVGLAISMVTDRTVKAGNLAAALVCGLGGIYLTRNPLALLAGTGKLLGVVLIIRGSAGLLQERQFSAFRMGRILPELPALILGLLLLISPMTPSRLILRIIGVVLILGAAAKFFAVKGDLFALREPEDPNIIDADE